MGIFAIFILGIWDIFQKNKGIWITGTPTPSPSRVSVVDSLTKNYAHQPGDQFPPNFLGFDFGSGPGSLAGTKDMRYCFNVSFILSRTSGCLSAILNCSVGSSEKVKKVNKKSRLKQSMDLSRADPERGCRWFGPPPEK